MGGGAGGGFFSGTQGSSGGEGGGAQGGAGGGSLYAAAPAGTITDAGSGMAAAPAAAAAQVTAPAPVAAPAAPAPAAEVPAAEREFIYNQRTGQIRDPYGNIIGQGYSGADGFVNDPASEARADQGPIPAGLYEMGEAFRSARTGRNSIPLTPVGHNAHGRTALQAHGENQDTPGRSSRGCPILNPNIRQNMINQRAQGVRYFRVVNEPRW